MHYVQDLGQPFHSTQMPHPRMVIWSTLWKRGYEALVDETTRTIGNYHFAFEEYIYAALSGETSPFDECIKNTDELSLMNTDPYREEALSDPKTLALRVAKNSVALAPSVGLAAIHFFGEQLLEPGADLPRKKGTPNYADMMIRPDLVYSRSEMHAAACRAMTNSTWGTRALLQWMLKK